MFDTGALAQITMLQKQQIGTLWSFGQTSLGAAEKLLQLHFSTTRMLWQGASASARCSLGAQNTQEAFLISSEMMRAVLEKFAQYSRGAFAIMSEATTEVFKIVDAQVNEGNRQAGEFVDFAAKNFPPGSEHAAIMLKGAVGAASSAINIISTGAKHSVDWIEANLSSVASSALNGHAIATM